MSIFKHVFLLFHWGNFAVRDDDSDYCDGQIMADDSQVNSPSVERRSPLPLTDHDDREILCMFRVKKIVPRCFAHNLLSSHHFL